MTVLIRGAGDMASGIALRLFHAGYDIVMTELGWPTAIRRTVSFSEAVRKGTSLVEDVLAVRAEDPDEARAIMRSRRIPVLEDPQGLCIHRIKPDGVVDAILAKRNTGTKITDAPVVVGVGPGFTAGVDCHGVVETMRGHDLGRVILEGTALDNTGVPGTIGGYGSERVLRAPETGIFRSRAAIGDLVRKGDVVAEVNGIPMATGIDGVLRGLLPDGTPVTKNMKSGDVDPRGEVRCCFTVSDKARAVGGGVLEALMRFSCK